ncbi:hypothetical protein EPH_0001560 [Eimeria praecox]|uniref:Uncharacterized protein n=1 Tax=Eimeria praecox TaxID=51316 RepID=U6G1J7_9EIME|nr:hypothetical protein EPH_0001560 [Eimeria praecox]
MNKSGRFKLEGRGSSQQKQEEKYELQQEQQQQQGGEQQLQDHQQDQQQQVQQQQQQEQQQEQLQQEQQEGKEQQSQQQLLQQLNELEDLQVLAAQVADRIGSDEAFAAYKEVCKKTTESIKVKQTMKKFASRATQDAAAATRRVVDIQERLRQKIDDARSAQETETEIETETEKLQQETNTPQKSLINPSIRKELEEELQRIGRKAKAAFNQAFTAATMQQDGSNDTAAAAAAAATAATAGTAGTAAATASVSPMSLALTARKAATEAEYLLETAQ